MSIRSPVPRALAFPLTLLLIEFLDELVFGAQGAALPLIRDDLRLSYDQIGILLGVPVLVGNLLDPALGVLSDAWRRKPLILAGGIGFVLALALTAGARSFELLLIAFVLFNPSSGAFVGLSQVALVESQPARREQMMVRWSLFGSLGVLAGSLALSALASRQGDWRVLYAGFAVLSLLLLGALLLQRHDFGEGAHRAGRETPSLRRTLGVLGASLRRPRVLRWLALLEIEDLLGDILLGFVALYFVDVVLVSEAEGALAVTVLTGAWLVGHLLLVPLLERVRGTTYLRASAPLALVLYVLMLGAPDAGLKFVLLGAVGLVSSGWYAVVKGRFYGEMAGHGGAAMAISSVTGIIAGVLPVALGALAERFGLPAVMAVLALGPVGVMVLPPRGDAPERPLGAGDGED